MFFIILSMSIFAFIGASALVTINLGGAHSCNPTSAHWAYRMLFIDTQWVGTLQKEILLGDCPDYASVEQHLLEDYYAEQYFSNLFVMLQNETNLLLAEGQLIEYCAQLFKGKLAHKQQKRANLFLV